MQKLLDISTSQLVINNQIRFMLCMDSKSSCLCLYEAKNYRQNKTLMLIKMNNCNVVSCMHSST